MIAPVWTGPVEAPSVGAPGGGLLLTPPLAVAELARAQDPAGGPFALVTRTDVALDGQPCISWLLVASDQLLVISGEPTPRIERQFVLATATQFRAQAAVGSGFLQARIDGVWVDLLRYSNRLSERFAKVAAKLELCHREGHLVVEPEDELDPRHCAGCGLALRFPGDTCPRCIPRGAVVERVRDLLRPHRRSVIFLCLLLVAGVAAELAPPKLQQYLVDEVLQVGRQGPTPADLPRALLAIVLGLALVRVVSAAVAAWKGVVTSVVGTALTSELRAQLVRKLHQLSVSYYDRHQIGSLMNRVAYDTETLHSLIQHLTGGFLLQILQLVGVGLMLFLLHPRLAALALVPMPLVLGGSWFFLRYVYPKYYRYWDSSSKQAGSLTSMLSGIRVVKAFAQEGREFERFQASSDYLRGSRLEVEKSAALFSAAMQLVFSLGGLIVWYVGGRTVLGREMTLGSLMAFLAYLAMFYTPLSNLAQLTAWLSSFLTASQRIFELLDTPAQIRDPAAPQPWIQPRGHIRFEQVAFGYERHQPVLRQVDFEIRPGEMVGVVGRSGSGKTTLVNLLCRFYDVDSGRVTIDGIDVRDMARADLSRQVGIVLQESFLFRGTVRDNLVYGRPDALPEEILCAAKAAAAHDFIMRMPFGYDTPLGERGAGLSGGEKQRVSIARALLFNPQILVLDEATSNVDTESEKAIQEALETIARDRTTIAIAHRLSTLRKADRILVFDHGRLVESGTHSELLAAGGLYANLVRIQTQLTNEPSIDFLAHVDRDDAELAATATAAATTKAVATSTATRVAGTSERRAVVSNGLGRSHGASSSDNADEQGQPGETQSSSTVTWPSHVPRWLHPACDRLTLDALGTLRCELGQQGPALAPYGSVAGLFVVRAFGATEPERYLSLRSSNEDGQETEVGLIANLADWPSAAQTLVRAALERRYLVQRITSLVSIEQQHGLLDFAVESERGPTRFLMRWSQNQAQDHGPRGKLLIDVDDNRYLVPDVDLLPARQQSLFRRFIYW